MSVVVCDTMEVIKVFEYYFVICLCCVSWFNSKNKCNSNVKVIVIVIVWEVIVIGFLNASSNNNSNSNRLPIHFQ